jgi:two-component system chemotaxis response regulator CheY
METIKVLIVDDDAIVRDSTRKLMTDIFSDLNIKLDITEGCDGEDIIKQVKLLVQMKEKLFDLICTDECMSDINGSEAIRAIRHLIKDTQIIAITASSEEHKFRILESGADQVLSKPLSKKQLKEYIDEYILGC